MKKIIIFGLLFIVVFSCKSTKKTTTPQENNKLTEEVSMDTKTNTDTIITLKIIRQSCASLVAEIVTEKYYALGEPTWVPYNVRMTTPYKNVVNIANKCEIPNTIAEGASIKVILVNAASANLKPCVTCKMMDYSPQKRIYVKFIEKL